MAAGQGLKWRYLGRGSRQRSGEGGVLAGWGGGGGGGRLFRGIGEGGGRLSRSGVGWGGVGGEVR